MAGLPPGRSEVLAYKQVFPDAAVQCAAASAAPRAARARVPDARMNGRTPAIADASTRQTRTRSTHARTGTIQRTRTSANRLCECFTDQKLIVTSTCQRRNNDRARIQMTRMNIATRQRQSFFWPPRWRSTSLGGDAPWNPTTAFPCPHERPAEPSRTWHRKAALNTLSPSNDSRPAVTSPASFPLKVASGKTWKRRL